MGKGWQSKYLTHTAESPRNKTDFVVSGMATEIHNTNTNATPNNFHIHQTIANV